MAVATYSKSGVKSTTPAKLEKKVFGVEVKNHDLLKDAYLTYLANGRTNLAVTKKRGEVRGGGKKPWRQKGTGRARFGSSRNPIWRGGGVVFGPTGNENYSRKLSLAIKHQALRQALSLAAKEDRLKIVETFAHMETKTKDMVNFLDKIDANGNILCVVSGKDTSKERATQNISYLKVSAANYLNVFDVLNADYIVMSRGGLEAVQVWLGGKK